MPRLPYAAKTLTEQVRRQLRRSPDSKAGLGTSEPVGDPDGFGVHRSVRFDKTASKWLEKVLPHLDDERIESFEKKDGRVTVHFTGAVTADNRDRFPLEAAETVADYEPLDNEGIDGQDPPGDGGDGGDE